MHHSAFVAAMCAVSFATAAVAQSPPALEDFAALAAKDEKVSEAAAERLAQGWKDNYAAMVLDLARFFRPDRQPAQGQVEDDRPVSDDEPRTGGAPRGDREPFRPAIRTPESLIRGRLMRFLSRQTGKTYGNDLKLWRKWLWTLPDDPHPRYAAFKGRLYANVDPRMAAFFESAVKPRIRLDEIDWGGVGPNGIPPLDQPKVLTADAAKYLAGKNVVFGIVVNGEARAYPKRILAWHEMARDTVGGVKLAVVYCTLCGTVIPYETVVGGRSFALGTSGLLYRSNKLMFDLETMSLWSTIEGRPVVGPLADSSIALKPRPVVTTTWEEWRKAHPGTTVLSLDTGYQRDYDEGVAYRAYFSHDDLMFEVPAQDKRLKRKAEVVTFFAGGELAVVPVALEAAFLRKRPVHPFSASGVDYVALTTPGGANRIYEAGGTSFVRMSGEEVLDDRDRAWKIGEEGLDGPGGETCPRVPARRTFWFAWFSQFPGTTLIQ